MWLFISVDLDGLADEIAEIRTPLDELSGIRMTDPTFSTFVEAQHR